MKVETNSSKKILVAIATAQNGVCRGIGRYAREHGWHLVMDMAYTGVAPLGWNGDGMLVLPGYNRQLHTLIRGAEVPCVTISLNSVPPHGARIEGDNPRIGRIAADHFIERGYQHFAWAPCTEDTINHERLTGFLERLAEFGWGCRTLPPAYVRGGLPGIQDWQERRARLIRELRQLPRPAAIFASNDLVAADVIDACRDAGLSVPEQIAVLGVDNEEAICGGTAISLSSIQHDLEEIGYRAAGLLDRVMQHVAPPDEVVRVAPTGVVVRLSTDMLAVENERVAHALRYIAEHFASPMLSVSGIASAIGVSRRHLERMFRTELRCTINERIVQTRMQAAARLLKAHPDARMPDVAHSVGLNQPKNFFRTFRRHFQMTPQRYREGAAGPAWLPPAPENAPEPETLRLAAASGT